MKTLNIGKHKLSDRKPNLVVYINNVKYLVKLLLKFVRNALCVSVWVACLSLCLSGNLALPLFDISPANEQSQRPRHSSSSLSSTISQLRALFL